MHRRETGQHVDDVVGVDGAGDLDGGALAGVHLETLVTPQAPDALVVDCPPGSVARFLVKQRLRDRAFGFVRLSTCGG